MDRDMRCKCSKVRCVFLHMLLIVAGDASGVKNLSISVPPMVRSGDTVTLSCNYDLQGGQLYRIQWYLDEKEFYRFTPAPPDVPHQLTYDVGDICVNVSKSNMYDVTLMDVSRNMTGNYKCEVTNAGTYYTANKDAFMEVVVCDISKKCYEGGNIDGMHIVFFGEGSTFVYGLTKLEKQIEKFVPCEEFQDAPKTDPRIDIEKERIAVGQTLQANCTSGGSRPASAITWKLNGQTVNNETEFASLTFATKEQFDGTAVTISTLRLVVRNDMFHHGHLHLRCTASIAEVYQKSAEVEIIDESPRLAPITRDASPHSHLSSGCGRVGWMRSSLPSGTILATALTTLPLLLVTMLAARITLR